MRFIIIIILGVLVSFYLFPVGLNALAESWNTKMLLAILGVGAFFLDYTPIVRLKVNGIVLGSILISILFSVVCFYAADYNYTSDYSYATYFSSFFVWVFGAYFVGWAMRYFYGRITLRTLSYYLLGVCAVQCALALLIDYIPPFKSFVDSYISQGQFFLNSVNRLYGIGASLDSAGVRFSVVLLITSAVMNLDQVVRSSSIKYGLLLAGFLFIAVVGNMISRTTTIGLLFSLLFFMYGSGAFRIIMHLHAIKRATILVCGLALIGAASYYLYRHNPKFYANMRFGFEGFFSWAETGVWRTHSTDVLNYSMWVWPEDLKTWIIGTGLFGHFVYGTDIGYCRFIMYCGLIGFVTFSLLFVYNAIGFMLWVPRYWLLFLLLGALTFIIWIKVSTDIFFIYALLYIVDSFSDETQQAAYDKDNKISRAIIK